MTYDPVTRKPIEEVEFDEWSELEAVEYWRLYKRGYRATPRKTGEDLNRLAGRYRPTSMSDIRRLIRDGFGDRPRFEGFQPPSSRFPQKEAFAELQNAPLTRTRAYRKAELAVDLEPLPLSLRRTTRAIMEVLRDGYGVPAVVADVVYLTRNGDEMLSSGMMADWQRRETERFYLQIVADHVAAGFAHLHPKEMVERAQHMIDNPPTDPDTEAFAAGFRVGIFVGEVCAGDGLPPIYEVCTDAELLPIYWRAIEAVARAIAHRRQTPITYGDSCDLCSWGTFVFDDWRMEHGLLPPDPSAIDGV